MSNWLILTKNVSLVHHCYPKPATLAPATTHGASSAGGGKCLPWIYLLWNVFSLGIPYYFIYGFFTWMNRLQLAGVKYISLFCAYTHKQTEESHFKLFCSELFQSKQEAIWTVFPPIAIMENYNQREGTSRMPNTSRVLEALEHATGDRMCT